MIDEKKLIEELGYYISHAIEERHDGNKYAYEQCKKLIERQPKVDGLIPCSERMPEDYVNVLAEYEWGGFTVTFFSSKAKLWFADSGHHYTEDIIAWMPLPEPYKDE